MTTIDLLIFDCDGVLIDSEPVASRTLAEALQRAGIPVSASEAHHLFTGYSEKEIRRMCASKFGLEDADRVFSEWHGEIYQAFARSLRPMPGMEPLIWTLPQRKCVASNSSIERLQKSLGLFDLWRAFAPHVFSAEMVTRPKPAPDLFLHCARHFSVEPSRCLVVDDSPHGIIGAVAAGMQAIGFVDPADPREGRRDILAKAGAGLVVTGADELAFMLKRQWPGAIAEGL